jgi:hypothetical protein
VAPLLQRRALPGHIEIQEHYPEAIKESIQKRKPTKNNKGHNNVSSRNELNVGVECYRMSKSVNTYIKYK